MGGIVGTLVDFIRGIAAFSETLQNAGFEESVTIRLSQADGERLLELLTGKQVEPADLLGETQAIRRLELSGLCFEWPQFSQPAANQASELLKPILDAIDATQNKRK